MDNQQIFQQYKKILNEIGLPGGARFSVGSRLGAWAGKKFTGGLLGKGAQANVNVEKDSNYFLGKLQDDSRHAGMRVQDFLSDAQQLATWFNRTLQIKNSHNMPSFNALVDKASKTGKHSDIYNLVKAAVEYRNRVSKFGVPSAQQPAEQQPKAQQPAEQQPKAQQSKITKSQGQDSIDQTISVLKKIRSRDRKKLIDYAKNSLNNIIPNSQNKADQSNIIPMNAAAESVFIHTNIITEKFNLIDCRRF